MKNVKFFTLGLAVFALAALFTSCQKEKDGPGDPNLESRASSFEHYPNWQSGNAASECAQAEASCSSHSLKVDPPLNGFYEHNGNTIVVEFSADGKTLSWSSDYKVCAVVVKGGNNGAIVYYYEDGACEDEGLVAPRNKNNNNQPEISHVSFCWGDVECEIECEDETAYGGGSEGGGSAWWYYFDTHGLPTQSIYAGQNLTDGNVTWNGTHLIIDLGSLILQDDEEAVKVMGYNDLPSARPQSGNSNTNRIYAGTDLTIQGNESRYYVIHLDVEICE